MVGALAVNTAENSVQIMNDVKSEIKHYALTALKDCELYQVEFYDILKLLMDSVQMRAIFIRMYIQKKLLELINISTEDIKITSIGMTSNSLEHFLALYSCA